MYKKRLERFTKGWLQEIDNEIQEKKIEEMEQDEDVIFTIKNIII